MSDSPNARLEARLPAAVHALLKRAAQIQGRSLSDFVIEAARDAAIRTIEETTIVHLSIEDQLHFTAMIENPPLPSAALQRAFLRRSELLGDDGDE
jgi:uncharacterized protein (DUF1778 family)